MAYEFLGYDITARSSGDMSSYQYHLVTLSTSNDNDGVTLSTASGKAHGVWQGPTSTVVEYGTVRVFGVSKLYMTSSDTAAVRGTYIKVGASGHGEPSTAGTVNAEVCGVTLDAVSTGVTKIVTAIIFPTLPASTST